MPNRIPVIKIKCDHKGEGMYWCKDCKPTLQQMAEWLGAMCKRYNDLKTEVDERARRDADNVR